MATLGLNYHLRGGMSYLLEEYRKAAVVNRKFVNWTLVMRDQQYERQSEHDTLIFILWGKGGFCIRSVAFCLLMRQCLTSHSAYPTLMIVSTMSGYDLAACFFWRLESYPYLHDGNPASAAEVT